MMIFFATCGRGMENFVKKELCETENVCKSESVSEGKVIFCLCKVEEETDPMSLNDNQTCISNLEKLNWCCQEYTKTLKSFLSFKVLFNLKMVEKVYYLLFLKTISNQEDIQKLSGKKIVNACISIH